METSTRLWQSDSQLWYLQWPVLVVLAIIGIVGLGPWLPLFDLDEGAFTEATREMLASGNWVSTYLNGEPRHDKPILIYWLQATSTLFFGFNELALRLPSIVCSFIWLAVTYRFVKETLGETAAKYCLFIMATAWLALPIYKAAIADALLNCILCLLFWEIYRYTQKANNSRLMRIGALMGLGFIAKGPVAVVLPLASYLVALGVTKQWQVWVQAVFNWRAILPFLLVITPWHIAVYIDQGWGFFEGFYLGHNLGRFSETMEEHGGSPLYYLILMPLLLMPFFRQFCMAVWELKQQPLSLLNCVLLAWFLITLAVFSFSKTQLPHYMLYGLTPAYLLVARRLATKEGHICWMDWGFGLAGVALFCLFPLLIPSVLPTIKHAYEFALSAHAYALYADKFLPIALLILSFAIICTAMVKSNMEKLLVSALAVAMSVNFVVMPLVADAQQTPVKEAALMAKSLGGNAVYYQTTMPSFSVYRDQIVTKDLPQEGDLVLTRLHALDDLQQLQPEVELHPLYQKGGIALIRYGQVH